MRILPSDLDAILAAAAELNNLRGRLAELRRQDNERSERLILEVRELRTAVEALLETKQ